MTIVSKNHRRKCMICGCEFPCFPSSRKKTCSSECRKQLPMSWVKTPDWCRLRRIWSGIKKRCLPGSNHPSIIKYYFGRVSVCEAWLDFRVFYNWAIENGYQNDLEIDRINPRGHYEPSNCRWATRRQQMANTQKRKSPTLSVFKGVSRRKSGSWTAAINKDGRSVCLGAFDYELHAAIAYDIAAKAEHGNFARVNFPEATFKAIPPKRPVGVTRRSISAMRDHLDWLDNQRKEAR